MQHIFFPVKTVSSQITPHKKSDAANDDQQHNHDIYHTVIVKSGQRRILSRISPHQIKAGITESGNRMENGKTDSLSCSEYRYKPHHEKQRSHTFYQDSSRKCHLNQTNNTAHLHIIHAFL